MMKALIFILALAIVPAAFPQVNDSRPRASNLPDPARKCWEASSIDARYSLSDRINPLYLRGDFDGDSEADYAVLATDKKSQHIVIVVCRSASRVADVLGEGGVFLRVGTGADGYDLKDFDWMDGWEVAPRQPLASNSERNKFVAPPMAGEAIHVIKTGSADAYIYWSGKRWVWYQLGD